MECHKLLSRLAWRNSSVCTQTSSEKCLSLLGYVWATQENRWFSGASVCQLTFFWVWDSAKSAATLPKSGHKLKGEKHCASRLSVNQTVFSLTDKFAASMWHHIALEPQEAASLMWGWEGLLQNPSHWQRIYPIWISFFHQIYSMILINMFLSSLSPCCSWAMFLH